MEAGVVSRFKEEALARLSSVVTQETFLGLPMPVSPPLFSPSMWPPGVLYSSIVIASVVVNPPPSVDALNNNCALNCNKEFTLLKSAEEHKVMHNYERSFACSWPDCPRAFTQSQTMYRHVRTFHQKVRKFVCHCGQRFAYKTHLTSHERVHEKPSSPASSIS